MLPSSLTCKAYLMGDTGTPLQVLRQSTPFTQALNALVAVLIDALPENLVQNYDNTNQDPQANWIDIY